MTQSGGSEQMGENVFFFKNVVQINPPAPKCELLMSSSNYCNLVLMVSDYICKQIIRPHRSPHRHGDI